MWGKPLELFKSNRSAQTIGILFVVLTIWWLVLNPLNPEASSEQSRYIWGASYQIVALVGGIMGLVHAKAWGGIRSVMGRAIIAFAIGLLLQAFGQTVYSYYNLYLKVEAPYPSVGDIGFFGSIPLYIYGVILLARASGTRVSLRAFKHKMQAILLPLILLAFSYIVFLRHYEFDWSVPLQVFLDFGYPLGQAIYLSLAILAYLLSRNILGGVMRAPVLFVLIALVVQYLSDYNFLTQFSKGTWFVSGYGDFLYLLSYFLMAVSLVHLGAVYENVRRS